MGRRAWCGDVVDGVRLNAGHLQVCYLHNMQDLEGADTLAGMARLVKFGRIVTMSSRSFTTASPHRTGSTCDLSTKCQFYRRVRFAGLIHVTHFSRSGAANPFHSRCGAHTCRTTPNMFAASHCIHKKSLGFLNERNPDLGFGDAKPI